MGCFILVDTAAIRHLEVFVNFFQLYLEPYAVDFADEIAWQCRYIFSEPSILLLHEINF